jgi:DNA-binding transcriptional LysR family regulator
MDLDLRRLRYFVAVADLGSVTKAASHVYVSQPSLTRQLVRLEEELGVQLFVRDRHRLRLAPAGERLLPLARDLIARAAAASAAVHELSDSAPITLSVAAPPSTIADIITPFVASRGRHEPTIKLREELPKRIFQLLERNEVDIAISSGPPPGQFASAVLVRSLIWAYVARGHRWNDADSVAMAELVKEPLIVLTRDHGVRLVFDEAVASAALSYEQAVETEIPQFAQALAASGRGVAVVSDDPRYDLRPLDILDDRGQPLRITNVAAWNRSNDASHAIARWVRHLTAYCSRRYGDAPFGAIQTGSGSAARRRRAGRLEPSRPHATSA